jgi:MoaA/NifB/PqqE/SkfB family radical SAM enzyme
MRQIVITISAYYLDRMDKVADTLREEGVTITRLYEFGVIVWYAEEDTIARIRHQKEIASLRDEKEAEIPPPGEDIQ